MPGNATLEQRYDAAAPGWWARMDALGYPAAYHGLIAAHAAHAPARMLDAGCGAGDFAAAWRAERGGPERLTLLDPSLGMLADGDRAVTDVALSVGYASSSAFNAAFRDFTGLAPGAWRDGLRQA